MNVSFIMTEAANFRRATLKYSDVPTVFHLDPLAPRTRIAQTLQARKLERRPYLYPIGSIVAVLQTIPALGFKST